MPMFQLDRRCFLFQKRHHVAKSKAFSTDRINPVSFSSVVRQQQTTGCAVRVAQVPACELIAKSFLKISQRPAVVGNFHFHGDILIGADGREPDVRAVSVGDFFLPGDRVGAVRPFVKARGDGALHLRFVGDAPNGSPIGEIAVGQLMGKILQPVPQE